MTTTITQPSTTTTPALPDWVTETTEWQESSWGKLHRNHTGEHHGATVQLTEYPDEPLDADRVAVIKRGPACPAWCRTHTYTRPELPDLTPTVSHERVILSGSMWVTLSQIQTLPHGIVFEPSIHCSSQAMADLTVEDARNLVRAIEYALDRIEEGGQA